jgi:hypothetical protein
VPQLEKKEGESEHDVEGEGEESAEMERRIEKR